MVRRILDDDDIKELIFDCMLQMGVNYMPTIRSMRELPSIKSERKDNISGKQLANAIQRTGGLDQWRLNLFIMTKGEYIKIIKTSRMRGQIDGKS